MTLEGRTALVTGASGEGIGRSVALTLARDGADIVVIYRTKRERAERVAEQIVAMGRRALVVGGDVAAAGDVEAMVHAAEAEFGPVDILVNSAGGPWKPQDITEITPEHFREVLDEEVVASFLLFRAVLPGMRARAWGRIVSIGGHHADDWPYAPPQAPIDYPLGKAARHWLTRTLARIEFARGITINAVAPGPTPYVSLEEALALLRGEGKHTEENTPQDIADVVAYLCSDAARRVTGAVIPVPGARPV